MSKERFAGSQHHHGCVQCNRRYVCSCQTPDVNGSCNSCKHGEVSRSALAWDPRPCCIASSPIAPMPKDQLQTYRLTGPTQWFKCPVCSRQFPCQPEQVKTQ